MGRRTLGFAVVAFGLLFGASTLSAQGVRVGGQISFADDTDFGIGPRLGIELPSIAPGLWLVGSFDYFFPDRGLAGTSSSSSIDYWEFNANLLYGVDLPDVTNLEPYFGAGLNLARQSVTPNDGSASVSDSRLGLNLVAGLDFPLTAITPFVEIRLEVDGGDQFVVTGGLTFP